jgi:DNA processing protein
MGEARTAKNDEAEAGRIRKSVEECLGPAGVTVDEIIRQTGAPVPAVQIILLELELAGRIARQPGNLVSWV